MSDETVRKAALKPRICLQKEVLSCLGTGVFPMSGTKGRHGKNICEGSDENSLVFLDESGVNPNMTRHYARSKTNERAVDSTPVNTAM